MGFFPNIFVYLHHKVFNVQTLTLSFFYAVTICHPCVHPQPQTVSAPGQAYQRAQWHPGALVLQQDFISMLD